MYNDESYPISLVMVPVTGLLVSALFFFIAVLPSVQLARWIVRKDDLTNEKGGLIAFWISCLIGGFLGLFKGDLLDIILGALYLSIGTLAFWAFAIKNQEANKA